MRILILAAASLFAVAACQPETKPAQESAAAQATLEELGQDDPDIAFEPAPVGPPKTYEAMSKTAMSFTPGKLTVTPTPQQSMCRPPCCARSATCRWRWPRRRRTARSIRPMRRCC